MHQIPGDNKNFRLVLCIGQTKFKAENVASTYNCLTPDLFSHDLIRSDEGLTLETSAFQIFHGGNSTFINSFDKTKLFS